jgi:hypothetical protein
MTLSYEAIVWTATESTNSCRMSSFSLKHFVITTPSAQPHHPQSLGRLRLRLGGGPWLV